MWQSGMANWYVARIANTGTNGRMQQDHAFVQKIDATGLEQMLLITVVLEKEKMIVNKKCGTCVFHKTDEHGEWYCGNQRSDYYCDYTDYNDTCIDWQKRAERKKNEID